MLKPYFTTPEHVNLISFERNPKQVEDQDLNTPHLENSLAIFDFKEIIPNQKNS